MPWKYNSHTVFPIQLALIVFHFQHSILQTIANAATHHTEFGKRSIDNIPDRIPFPNNTDVETNSPPSSKDRPKLSKQCHIKQQGLPLWQQVYTLCQGTLVTAFCKSSHSNHVAHITHIWEYFGT